LEAAFVVLGRSMVGIYCYLLLLFSGGDVILFVHYINSVVCFLPILTGDLIVVGYSFVVFCCLHLLLVDPV
jgi:hypothetical protein